MAKADAADTGPTRPERGLLGMNYKILAGTASAALLGAVLVVLAFMIGEGMETRAIHLLVLVFGASSGWLVGVVVSPYDAREAKTFPKYAGAVSAFASGYLVSKIDRVFEQVLRPEVIASSVGAFRLLGGLSAFLLAMQITYIYRAYAR